MKHCFDCEVDISNRHPNALRCVECAEIAKTFLPHRLTQVQQQMAVELADVMYQSEIAKEIGCTLQSLRRFALTKPDVNWKMMR